MYYAMYKGTKETKVPKGRIFKVGFYQSPSSFIVRCMGVEFIYRTEDAVLNDWRFFVPIRGLPVERSF